MATLKTKKNVSLASLSTFRIGGRVREFVEVCSADELVRAVEWAEAKKKKHRVFAGGSNIVFPDKGLDYLLIRMKGGSIDYEDKGQRTKDLGNIVVDAGVALADVVAFAISKGLQGLETLSGIPGTIGGAVYGNAGAYGSSISEVVEKVEVLCPTRMTRTRHEQHEYERRWISKAQCGFGYRESVFKKPFGEAQGVRDWIILRVVLELKKGDRKALKLKSREIIQMREKKYKPGIRCPGSFFKNILVKDVSKKSLVLVDTTKIIDGKIPAGWLLEQVGARGTREGGVYIADFHGNLLVNDGKGTAKDVKALARKLKKKVLDRFGIKLEEEVRYF